MGESNKHAKVRNLFRAGVIDALENATAHFASMQRTAQGKLPINAIALDIYPWHGSASLAVRTRSVPDEDRYAIADWPEYDFANQETSTQLKEAADFAAECYRNKPESMELIDAAHLIFLAAAEALLDASITAKLQDLGIDAPNLADGVSGSHFEYLVLDSDETCRANYCEIVRANRSTARTIAAWNGSV